MPQDEQQEITNEGPAAKYFASIPHMADDDLNPYAYRLYGHYVRVCGTGNRPCREHTTTTAAKTQMSVGAVSKYRRQLELLGYIHCEEIYTNGTMKLMVSLLDIWPQNIARYADDSQRHSPHERARSPHERARSPHERARSPHERARSPRERARSPRERYIRKTNGKNNSSEEEHSEEQQDVVVGVSSPLTSFVSRGGLGGDDRRRREWAIEQMQRLNWQNARLAWSRLNEDEQDDLLLWLWCYHFRTANRHIAVLGSEWEDIDDHLRDLPNPFDSIDNPGGWIRWNLAGGDVDDGPPVLPELHPDEIPMLRRYLLSDEEALYQ